MGRMRANRSGFTLVEVIVAILVLGVGLLGLLGAAASTIRVIGEGDRAVAAAYHSSGRIDQLTAQGCDDVASGSETVDGVYLLTWSVAGDSASRVRPIMVTAEYPGVRGRVRVDTFETGIPCAR